MKYFPLHYRLHREERYLIWISNASDSVATSPEGFVLTFRDPSEVQAYADRSHYALESEEPVLHNLDWVARWLKTPGTRVDCRAALAAWNLFSDVAQSLLDGDTAFGRLDKQFPGIYEKLFWGNNLPSVTPEGRQYIPVWSQDELASIAGVLRAGLEMFQSHTRPFHRES